MKLVEIFDQGYYDHIQRSISDKQQPEQSDDNSDETSMQDFIISAFEADQMTYEQALAKLKEITPADQMFFWEHELSMADELKK